MYGVSKQEYLVDLEYITSLPPLHACAYKGLREECRKLLDQEDTDVNHQDLRKNTALHIVRDPEIVRLLLEKGADVNIKHFKGGTALHEAACYGRKEKVKLLLDAGALVDDEEKTHARTPLHEAVDSDYPDVEIVDLLLERGADVNAKTRLYRQTPLHLAAAKHNTVFVKKLLKMGANVNSAEFCQNTPLHTALGDVGSLTFDSNDCTIHDPNTETVETLLEYGANVNMANSLTGETPLHHAAENCSGEIVQLLLANKAEVNACNHFGQTPLMLCAGASCDLEHDEEQYFQFQYQDLESESGETDMLVSQNNVLQILLGGGAEINAQDMNGYSALNHAFSQMNQQAVLFLKARGADLTLKDRFGASAIHYATHASMKEVLEELTDSKPGIVREKDKFGSTPLHWAAWYGNDEAINTLIDRGALRDDVDHDGHTAGDIARLKGDEAVMKLLGDIDTSQTKIVAIEAELEGRFGTYWLPTDTSLEQCTSAGEILQLIQNIPDKSDFLLSALRRPGLGMVPDWKESGQVLEAVTTLAQAIVGKIGHLDERFVCSIVPSGSSHEGTKCGAPDEFDFMCCLEELSQWCESDDSASPAGFTTIRKKQATEKGADPFADFFEENGLLNVMKVNEAFYTLALEAVWSKDLWPKLQFVAEDQNFFYANGPSCVIQIQWRGQLFKDMEISIDVVPALRLDHWPNNAIKSTSLVKGGALESQGCHIVVKEPTVGMCDLDDVPNCRDFMRISFSKLETSILQNMPQPCREALTLMKTIRFLCTAIVYCFPEQHHNVSEMITTYMLKTVLFQVLDKSELHQFSGESAHETTLCVAREVFRKLEKALEEQTLPSFFIPSLNLLQPPPALTENEIATLAIVERENKGLSESVRLKLTENTTLKDAAATLAAARGVTLAAVGGVTLAAAGGATLAAARGATMAAAGGATLAAAGGATLAAAGGATLATTEGATLATTGGDTQLPIKDATLAATGGATLAATGGATLAASERDGSFTTEDLTPEEEFKEKLKYQLRLIQMINKLYFK